MSFQDTGAIFKDMDRWSCPTWSYSCWKSIFTTSTSFSQVLTSRHTVLSYDYILPGSLTPPSNIVPKVGNEPDAQFCFVLDALDYLENLMETQKAIFRTMDRSKNSTSSASGHNRLCACIPIIADSEQLYSFCVKFLSLLHSQLPSEPLAGFRTRFLHIYNDLKTFYEQCVTILYIRQLIQGSF